MTDGNPTEATDVDWVGNDGGADGYDELFEEEWGATYEFWHEVIDRSEEQVSRLVNEVESVPSDDPVRILDVGCGDGTEMSRVVERTDRDVTLVGNDISAEALSRYQENLGGHVDALVQSRLELLPSQVDGDFDLVVFSHCLHNVDLTGLFDSYAKVLDDDGRVVVLLESRTSTIVSVRERFWNQVHGTPLDENTGEDVLTELQCSGYASEMEPIEYGVDLDLLYEIDDDGLKNLYIPFALRTRNVEHVEDRITQYLERQAEEGAIPQRTLFISAERRR